MRRALGLLAVALVAAASAGAAAAAAGDLDLTPIGRLPFPERGYVIDLRGRAAIDPSSVVVRENGRRVTRVDFAPVSAAGIHFGVVLAIDASESMTGPPLAGAVEAARVFVARRDPDQEVGIVAFNGDITVLEEPTKNADAIARTLAEPPRLAYGTRIYDAVETSLAVLARARLSNGSIVLLSDGADIGSTATIEKAIARARARHVRIFTVGLRSGAFDPRALRRIASETGGTFAEASSPERLSAIYDALSRRLASEYVVRYRSGAAPRSEVDVAIELADLGTATTRYIAPTPSGLAPYHRSGFQRFVASPLAPFALSLLVAALVALSIVSFARPRRNTLLERVQEFAGPRPRRPARTMPRRITPRRATAASGALARLERTLEIARIDVPARRIVLLTVVATAFVVAVLWTLVPVFAILGLLTPLLTRAYVVHKLRDVRETFADQLAPNLQVLASALRAGHSFTGALDVVVENAHEPSRSELRHAVADEQLGVPIEDAIRRVAERMKNRDLEQVALLAELQRTAGGNAAEVLDTVVATQRDRSDLRRLIRTLTAQGRMARWILSVLPIAAGLILWLLQPTAVVPMFQSSFGQILLVAAALMIVAGSLAIQKIVDIKV